MPRASRCTSRPLETACDLHELLKGHCADASLLLNSFQVYACPEGCQCRGTAAGIQNCPTGSEMFGWHAGRVSWLLETTLGAPLHLLLLWHIAIICLNLMICGEFIQIQRTMGQRSRQHFPEHWRSPATCCVGNYKMQVNWTMLWSPAQRVPG